MTDLHNVLAAERDSLRERLAAIETLLGESASAPRSRQARRTTTTTPNQGNGGRRRGPGRTPFRTTQFMEIVQGSPGIAIRDAAEKMNVQPNYLYRLVAREVERGNLRKDENGGYHLVAKPAEQPQEQETVAAA